MRHPVSKPVSPVDLSAPTALAARLTPLRSLLGSLNRTHRMLLALLALALLMTALAHPIERAYGGWIATRVPGSWVYAGSIQSLQRLDASTFSPSKLPDEVQMQIRSRFASLRMPSDEAPLYELVFRQGNALGAQSFALAGGQIVVTDELVSRLNSEQDMMAALALQLGHLQHKHALRAITDHSPLSVTLSLLSDDANRGIELIGKEQPVMTHDAHRVVEAQRFADTVMRANVANPARTGRTG